MQIDVNLSSHGEQWNVLCLNQSNNNISRWKLHIVRFVMAEIENWFPSFIIFLARRNSQMIYLCCQEKLKIIMYNIKLAVCKSLIDI